jgi:hypothetical protein
MPLGRSRQPILAETMPKPRAVMHAARIWESWTILHLQIHRSNVRALFWKAKAHRRYNCHSAESIFRIFGLHLNASMAYSGEKILSHMFFNFVVGLGVHGAVPLAIMMDPEILRHNYKPFSFPLSSISMASKI